VQGNVLPPGAFPHTRQTSEERVSSSLRVREDPSPPQETSACISKQHQAAEEALARPVGEERRAAPAAQTPSKSEAGTIVRRSPTPSVRTAPHASSLEKGQRLTIERAVQEYLQAHRIVGHRPKTLEWHQMALSHLQAYLLTECHLMLVHQITEEVMRNWLASLAQTPTTRGAPRSASTIETYARSARAFFRWLVERGMLACSSMSESAFPRASIPLPDFVSPATFEQVMRAGVSPKAQGHGAERLGARDQALLWVLFDTGITVSELCALRVADLDLQTGLMRVRGKGGQERQMALGPACLGHLRWYLKQMNPTTRRGLTRRKAGGDPLFGSKGKQPLTKNGVTMVFARFRKRAGISGTTISPQVLRHSFALQYLQTGGSPQVLQELLGYEGMAPVKRYLRWHDQLLHEQTQQESEGVIERC
jgi:site-specific recombinase XerD